MRQCTLPLTGKGVVDMRITDLGVFEIDETGTTLTELAADVTLAESPKGPTPATKSPRRCKGGNANPGRQMKHESASIVQMSPLRDGLAGVTAFKDKVEPNFVGS